MAGSTIIRTSGLPNYPACPRRWATGVIGDEIKAAGFVLRDGERGIAPAIGSSVHKAAELTLREKAESGKLPPITVATDIAVQAVKEEIRQGISYDSLYTLNASDAERQVSGMAGAYHGHIAPKIEPLMIETRLEAEISWSSQKLILSGQMDIVAREPKKLRDLKTGLRYGNHNAQVGGYELLLRSHAIDDIYEASIDFIKRVSVKKPQPRPEEKPVPLTIAGQAATNILQHIDQDLSVWRSGDARRGLLPGDPAAFVANPSCNLCSAKYCRAHSAGPNGWCNDWDRGDE